MSNARPPKDYLCKLYKEIDYQLFMLSNEGDGSRRDERRHLRNSLRHSRFAVYIHIGGNLVKKMVAICLILVLALSGVFPVFGSDTESQALSAQDIAALSSMGLQAATEADRAGAAGAGVAFRAVSSVADAAEFISQVRTAISNASVISSTQASTSSTQKWYSCTKWAFTWGVKAEARVDRYFSDQHYRFGTVHETKLTMVGFHLGFWLHNPSQSTTHYDNARRLQLNNHHYVKVGINVLGNDVVLTLGPYDWHCTFWAHT